jgi:hypothetical protein
MLLLLMVNTPIQTFHQCEREFRFYLHVAYPVLKYLNVMHYVFAVKLTILGCMLLQLVANI